MKIHTETVASYGKAKMIIRYNAETQEFLDYKVYDENRHVVLTTKSHEGAYKTLMKGSGYEDYFYVLSCFDTKSKHISNVIRDTADEALQQIIDDIAVIPHSKENEKIDHKWDERICLVRYEHNAYVKDEEGTEWFWQTSRIRIMN